MSSANGNRILRLIIIDSDRRMRVAVRQHLGDRGTRVIGEADDLKTGSRLVRGLQPDVVIMELPPNASETVDAIKQIKDELPDTVIILSSPESSPQLIMNCIRAGAQEFISRPIEGSELDRAMEHARKLAERRMTASRKRGTVLSIFASKGGVGATSMVTNLGVALCEQVDASVVLVDLSFHMGDLGLMFDQPPKYGLTDAFHNGALDESKLRSIVATHSSGAHLLTLVTSPEMSDDVTSDHVIELIGTLSTMYDYVLVDIGRHLDDRTVEVLELSDAIIVMAALDIPTIRNVSRYLDIFERLEIDPGKTHLVVNRFHKRSRVNLKDIEQALGVETFWAIPNDYDAMSLAIDQGIPAVIESPKSKVAQSYKDLAIHLSERLHQSHEPLETTAN